MPRPTFYKERTLSKLEEGIQQAEASGVSAEALATLKEARDMLENKSRYTEHAASENSATAESIEEETHAHDWKAAHERGDTTWNCTPFMISGRVEGQFLKSIVSGHKAKRVLEVGLFTGYSAICMAEALPDDGEVVSLEISPYMKTLVQKFTKDSPHAKKINVILGDGTENMKKLAAKGEKFDIIFLDGDKKAYVEQMNITFDLNLLAPGGTLLIDNAYTMGHAYMHTESIGKTLLEAIKARPELHRVLLPLNDGVLMVRRLEEVEPSRGKSAAQ